MNFCFATCFMYVLLAIIVIASVDLYKVLKENREEMELCEANAKKFFKENQAVLEHYTVKVTKF